MSRHLNSPEAPEAANEKSLKLELTTFKDKRDSNNSSHSSKNIAADMFSDHELSPEGRSSSSSSKRRPHENDDEDGEDVIEDMEEMEDTEGDKELKKAEELTAVDMEEKEVINKGLFV